jgi:hypothetical protein
MCKYADVQMICVDVMALNQNTAFTVHLRIEKNLYYYLHICPLAYLQTCFFAHLPIGSFANLFWWRISESNR